MDSNGTGARNSGGAELSAEFIEVETVLPVPVVGTISTDDGPPIPRRRPGRARVVRYATLVGELTMAAAVLVMLLAASSESTFSTQFVQDPFGAFSDAVARAGNWVL